MNYLFRGKQAGTEREPGEWVLGCYVHLNAGEDRIYTGCAERDCGEYYPEFFAVDPDTVGRVLEYMDRNSKLLCEGDIIQSEDYHGKRMGVVGFSGAMSIPFLFGIDGFSDEYLFNETHIVVVGNIHDNPELVREHE